MIQLRILACILLTVCSAPAQETWTAATTGTTQDLWGATWTGSQFVVVGNSGTILTSRDGQEWTSRASGTSEWLLAAVYSPERQRHVVVGDHGTILTSTDAITWSTQLSPTTERLNGVAWGNGRFLAVGENSTVLSSPDGITWSANKVTASGWLRGVAYVKDRFYFGGAAYLHTDPRMPNYTTPDGVDFQEIDVSDWGGASEYIFSDGENLVATNVRVVVTAPASFPLAPQIRFDVRGVDWSVINPYAGYNAVALFRGSWIGAGAVGVISQAPLDGIRSGTAVSVGGVLRAATASPDVAIVAGSAGRVMWSPPAEPRAPKLEWRWDTNTLIRAERGDSVKVGVRATGSGPMSVQWLFNGVPIPGATTTELLLSSVHPEAAGRYTVSATNALGKTMLEPLQLIVVDPIPGYAPDAVDPAFKAPNETTIAAVLPDKRLLAWTKTNSTSTLRRLLPNGAIDPDFRPSEHSAIASVQVLKNGQLLLIGSPKWTLTRLNADGSIDQTFDGSIAPQADRVLPLADNRMLLLKMVENTLTATRLLADGSFDTRYPATSIVIAPPRKSPLSLDPNFKVGPTAELPDGRFLIAAASSLKPSGIAGSSSQNLSVLLLADSDGTIERSAFATLSDRTVEQMVANDRGIYVVSRIQRSGMLALYYYRSERLALTGAVDAGYTSIEVGGGSMQPADTLMLQPDGSLWRLRGAHRTDAVRYDALGVRDSDFSLHLESAPAVALTYHILDAGSVLVSGAYTTLNGVDAPGLARIAAGLKSNTHLSNLSIRQLAAAGDETLTLGLVVTGHGTRTMLMRAVGPTLAAFGVPNPLQDPTLTVGLLNGPAVATNDDWNTGADPSPLDRAAAKVGGFSLPASSRDAAVLAMLGEGSYTLQVGSANSGRGIALAECYDTDAPPNGAVAARVVNFSARAAAGSGSATLIAGFSIRGKGTLRLLIRGVGPTLSAYGVAGVLPDPVLSLYAGQRVIECNNDVQASTPTANGAFPIGGKDAAMAVTLPAGTYTAQLTSATSQGGVALIEIYELP